MAPATRTKAARAWGLRSPATSRVRTAATSPSATARWAACARPCRSLCEAPCARLLVVAAAGQQLLQLFSVLDVNLEAAGHHDVARLLVRLAAAQPFRLDPGGGVADRRRTLVQVRGRDDSVG